MKFGVEVLVASGSMHITKVHDATSFINSLIVAQELATQMFPEDPMAFRIFRSGRYVYTNRNDLGDLVVIRPLIESEVKTVKPRVGEVSGFVFVTREPPNEPA